MSPPAQLPLPTLLSQTLVAFTVEFDNEAEHRLPHHTTRNGATAGELARLWLVSLAMYENCIRYIPDEGITAGELERLARTNSNLGGMHRWRYITIDPKPLNSGGKGIKPSSFITLTAGGKRAQEVWQPLFAEIEDRWRTRFGAGAIGELRSSLEAIVTRLDPHLPDCMPILHYGLVCKRQSAGGPEIGDAGRTDTAGLALSSLLAKPLLAFALAYEEQSAVSLAISVNILRVVDESGVPAKDIPRLSGVSKESIAMAESWLGTHGLIEVETVAGKRLARLTAKGVGAREEYRRRLAEIEDHWRAQLGAPAIDRLRNALTVLVGAGDHTSPLFDCLTPYPENWRAKVPKPSTLPHFPMVLHRGSYPDGS